MTGRLSIVVGLASTALVLAGPGGTAATPVVRFAFAGDIAMVAGPAGDYFRSVRKQLAGDVVLGTLTVVLLFSTF